MQIACINRHSLTIWLLATVALFAMPVSHPTSAHWTRLDIDGAPNQLTFGQAPKARDDGDDCRELRQWAAASDAICDEVRRYLSAVDPSMTPEKLWDAYDRLALAHLGTASNVDVDDWLTASPRGFAVGKRIAADRVLIVWSDPTYLAGARASLFTRSRSGNWAVVGRRTLDLEGQYVSLEWSRAGVFLIAGLLRGADAEWLSLIELDARGSHLSATPIVTDLYAGDERQTATGVVVTTIVAPKHFITHLFSHWREQEVTVEWTRRGFRTTRRETEPVIAALERYCSRRFACAQATLQDVEYVTDRQARAVFSSMPNDCEDGKPEVTITLEKTDRWRVAALECTPERSVSER